MMYKRENEVGENMNILRLTLGLGLAAMASLGCGSSNSSELDPQSCAANQVYIPGGTMMMGDAKLAPPVHSVTVSSFCMDTTEVTQAEYRRLMGAEPWASGSTAFGVGDNHPVWMVNWNDAVLFCNARSEEAGLTPVYTYEKVQTTRGITELVGVVMHPERHGFRLPTEAEWEYGARAGSATTFSWGAEADPAYYWNISNAGGGAHPVGTKLPNAFGLYDMSGNIMEWTNDNYGSYSAASATDPLGPPTDPERALRGGSWRNIEDPLAMASAFRAHDQATAPDTCDGFRTVLR
jgi:sulfatase modifying factor 1